jgi:hypothetical protein
MKVKIVAAVLHWVLAELKAHPELAKPVTDRIPGPIDEWVLAELLKHV